MSNLNFHSIEDEQQLRFYQMPKVLFTKEKYKGLTLGAKAMYSVLRDRQELSAKNNWVDQEGHIYLVFTIDNLCELLDVSNKTAIKYKQELAKYDLLFEKRMGQGKPNRIYVLKPDYSKEDTYEKEEDPISTEESYPQAEGIGNTKTCKNYTSRNVKSTSLEMKKLHTNDTEYSDTDVSDKSVSHKRQTDDKTDIILNALKDDIDLYDQEHQDLLVNSIKRLSCKVSPTDLLKLSYQHFDYSISKFKAAKKDNTIKNTAAYFDKILYNSIGELAASLI